MTPQAAPPIVSRAELGDRSQPSLTYSIGRVVEKGDRSHPEKLDYFRVKDGPYAAKSISVFGDKPIELRICPPSNEFGDMIDIRWKAYAGGAAGKKEGGYLKALGHDNLAELALAGNKAALNGPQTLTGWNKDGTSNPFEIAGPNDPAVAQHVMKIYTTLRFEVPEVMGVGAYAEIVTTARVSRDNLFTTLARIYSRLHGRWYGLELILYLQKATARPIVQKRGEAPARMTSTFWALQIRSPYSVMELLEQQSRLASIQAPTRLPELLHENPARDLEVSPPLWDSPAGDELRETVDRLPHAPDEGLRTREEPATVEQPDDALLNRIAQLRDEVGAETANSLLVGAYGVELVEQLDARTAAAYAEGLERLLPAEEVAGEVVEDELGQRQLVDPEDIEF